MRLSRTFESITLKNLRAHLEMTMTNSTTARNDGRRQRREDGRNKVIDAAISLVLDGHGVPSTEAVVERAGVSPASLFRYFENLDDLRNSFISRYFERIESALAVDQLGTGGLSRRVSTLCTARLEFFALHEPMATLGRTRSEEVPRLATRSIDFGRASTNKCYVNLNPSSPQCANHIVGIARRQSVRSHRLTRGR